MIMYKQENIFFTIDRNYVTHFSVTIISLLENNRGRNFKIYVIHDLDNDKPLLDVADFIRHRYDTELNCLFVDNSVFSSYRITHHVSQATYFRLLLAELIPAHVDRGLFLDSDIVITGSLAPLFDILHSEHSFPCRNGQPVIYAVHDNPEHDNLGRLTSMGFRTKRYFNAGMMLVSLNSWRENQVTQRLLDIANKHMEQLTWWDQDVLNICFLNSWVELDFTYNALDITEPMEDTPLVIHFAGSSKPWHFKNKHPYKHRYFQYLRKRKYRYLNPFVIFAYKKAIKFVNRALSLKYNESL